MRVLVACEYTGVVREAFKAKGHDAWSCDLKPSEIPGNHIQGDVLEIIGHEHWDLMIAHPPCTHLASSGARWFKDKKQEQFEAILFAKTLMNAPIWSVCIENPIGVLSTYLGKPSQIIQPWQYGHEAQKSTCLWLRNLPNLEPTNIVGKGKMYVSPKGKVLPEWYSNSKKMRDRTFQGIADAMANQWGTYG